MYYYLYPENNANHIFIIFHYDIKITHQISFRTLKGDKENSRTKLNFFFSISVDFFL